MANYQQDFELCVGMEVHAELLTESKMFCGCSAHFGGDPNSNVCPVCLGLPGSLPVANSKAIEHVIRTALALHCEISSPSIFYRKNYFYPDLPKGYQISQYGDDPIGKKGYLDFIVEGEPRRVHIRRVHLEEDTGKNLHVPGGMSEVDYNRSGVPLMEVVSDFPPDMHSPEECRAYLMALRAILIDLSVCDGRMEEGSLRCEPNISVRPRGASEYGPKVELKNLNSFRAVYRGVAYEWERQAEMVRAGQPIPQETRRFDEATGKTFVMRSKEFEQEYRYFPEPDLVPLAFDAGFVDGLRRSLPELPEARVKRLADAYGLSAYDASLLGADRETARYFEAAAREYRDPKIVANWINGELTRLLNASDLEIGASRVSPDALVEMLKLIDVGTISGKLAKTVFESMFQTGKPPAEIIKEQGLTQISDESELSATIQGILNANPKEVGRFRAGEEKLLAFFVGQVMRATRGKANPEMVNRLLTEQLKGD